MLSIKAASEVEVPVTRKSSRSVRPTPEQSSVGRTGSTRLQISQHVFDLSAVSLPGEEIYICPYLAPGAAQEMVPLKMTTPFKGRGQ
jgi:hypothetical protein